MLTQDNLKTTFDGEFQVNRMYFAFNNKRLDGKVGSLFRAVLEAETIHTQEHLQGLPVVGSTPGKLNEMASEEKDHNLYDKAG